MKLNNAISLYLESRHQSRKSRTVSQDFSTLSHFLFYLRDPNREVESITLEDCEQWLALVRQLGYDDNTRIKKALGIKLFFEHMFKRRIPVSFDPDLIPVPRKVFKFPRVATEDQYERLLAAVQDEGKCGEITYAVRDRAIIMLIHDTGARNGEIVSLDMDDIDLERKSARIKTEKSRGDVPYREIFWSREANEQLKKWVAVRERFSAKMEDGAGRTKGGVLRDQGGKWRVELFGEGQEAAGQLCFGAVPQILEQGEPSDHQPAFLPPSVRSRPGEEEGQ
jgi:site-specific recombinase XerD